MLATKTKSKISLKKTLMLDWYLQLAKQKYPALKNQTDEVILKFWINKGVEKELSEDLENQILAKQAGHIWTKDEGDQEENLNYNPKKIQKLDW